KCSRAHLFSCRSGRCNSPFCPEPKKSWYRLESCLVLSCLVLCLSLPSFIEMDSDFRETCICSRRMKFLLIIYETFDAVIFSVAFCNNRTLFSYSIEEIRFFWSSFQTVQASLPYDRSSLWANQFIDQSTRLTWKVVSLSFIFLIAIVILSYICAKMSAVLLPDTGRNYSCGFFLHCMSLRLLLLIVVLSVILPVLFRTRRLLISVKSTINSSSTRFRRFTAVDDEVYILCLCPFGIRTLIWEF
ncbi:hypothetical protein L9F63_000914, partial [Diploptera punctata]